MLDMNSGNAKICVYWFACFHSSHLLHIFEFYIIYQTFVSPKNRKFATEIFIDKFPINSKDFQGCCQVLEKNVAKSYENERTVLELIYRGECRKNLLKTKSLENFMRNFLRTEGAAQVLPITLLLSQPLNVLSL